MGGRDGPVLDTDHVFIVHLRDNWGHGGHGGRVSVIMFIVPHSINIHINHPSSIYIHMVHHPLIILMPPSHSALRRSHTLLSSLSGGAHSALAELTNRLLPAKFQDIVTQGGRGPLVRPAQASRAAV